MQATLPLRQFVNISKEIRHQSSHSESTSAAAEIHGYLAARDLLLREAEKSTTEINLRCAMSANEFAEDCLRPARSPYDAQALPEAEAARERERCRAARVRLAELRGYLRRRAA